jgi:membrane protease YdiL (CAAX protease family)
MENKSSSTFFTLSPIMILLITQASALYFGRILGPQVYIPIILIYWVVLGLILFRYGWDQTRKWLRKSQGHWAWIIIAVVVGLSSLPLFLQHYPVLQNLSILIPTIIFFLINPWLEEFYWRGMLLDVTEKWPAWISILYSTVLFTAFHSAFAWYSPAARNLPFYGAVMFLGLVMALIYKNTRSVRLAVMSHMIINFFNLSIPSLLNMIEF